MPLIYSYLFKYFFSVVFSVHSGEFLDEVLPVGGLHFDHVCVKSFVVGFEAECAGDLTELIAEVANS